MYIVSSRGTKLVVSIFFLVLKFGHYFDFAFISSSMAEIRKPLTRLPKQHPSPVYGRSTPQLLREAKVNAGIT
jgi:hypothetical protein